MSLMFVPPIHIDWYVIMCIAISLVVHNHTVLKINPSHEINGRSG